MGVAILRYCTGRGCGTVRRTRYIVVAAAEDACRQDTAPSPTRHPPHSPPSQRSHHHKQWLVLLNILQQIVDIRLFGEIASGDQVEVAANV